MTANNNQIALPEGIELEAKIMIVVWELTQGDGTKFVSAEELAAHIGRSAPYLKRICEAMTKGQHPRLVPKDAHLNKEQVGRKATLGYRLAEEAVNMQETARILIELLRNHQAHRVNRKQFVERMAADFGLDAAEINERIDEGIRFGYIERVPEKSLRGRELINKEFDYLTYLAEKVPPRRTPENPARATRPPKTAKSIPRKGSPAQ